MSLNSEEYLLKTLAEYNEEIGRLEEQEPSGELIEALANRGNVLSMLELYSSSLDDLKYAAALTEEIETDPGTFIYVHTALGKMCGQLGLDAAPHLRKAAEKLDKLNGTARHFDSKRAVRTCMDSSDLLIEEDEETALIYLNKTIELTSGKTDPWMENCRISALFDIGNIEFDSERYDDAL